ncbi:uncharacterized protein [Watersipora subatra]|uniref:uncharacterized protein n=1 Tax=Watersipora subatra TaxID=2589382 RepID=UPI00355AE62E
MQSISLLTRRIYKSTRLLYRSLCKEAKRSFPKVNGEWLMDQYPDIALVTTNSHQLVDSLVRRIQAKNHEVAEELVDELKSSFEFYKFKLARTKDISQKLTSEKLSPLTLSDLRSEFRASLRDTKVAYTDFMDLYNSFPNIIEHNDINQKVAVKSCLADTVIPSLKWTGFDQENRDDYQRSGYLTGEAAIKQLELQGFACEYLEQFKMVPVTFPSFVRQEVTAQSGVSTMLDSDIYTLLTKPEMHADADSSLDKSDRSNRKAKSEDNFVYQVHGLSEILLMTFFIRRNLANHLPFWLYSIGNQYRMPCSGEMAQSMVVPFVGACSTNQEALAHFHFGVNLIEEFWKVLKLDVIKIAVEPHHLSQHEACATEFIMKYTQKTGRRTVLSRMSLSNDYVGRRIMAYTKCSQDNTISFDEKFCFFATGNLVDISALIANI